MKKIIVFVAIAIVIFASCESKSGKIVEKNVFEVSFKSEVSFKKFKKMIITNYLDSCFIPAPRKLYDFYLDSSPAYNVSVNTDGAIPFNKQGKISISTRDIITGELVPDFCSDYNKWSSEQCYELLELLISRIHAE